MLNDGNTGEATGYTCVNFKEEQKSHNQISVKLNGLYPGVRGLSIRSVRRFCEKHDIHATSLLTNEDLDRVVSSSIAKVQN